MDLNYEINLISNTNSKNTSAKYRLLNGLFGSSIDAYQSFLNRVTKALRGRQFTINDTMNKVNYFIIFDIDPSAPPVELKEVKSKYSGEITKAFVLNISDSEETILAKLNSYLIPEVK